MRYALFNTRRLHRFLRLPKKGLWPLCFSLFLTACASAPQVAEKSVSQFTDLEPAPSPLVTLATSQPDSGIRLLADPSEALQSRLHLKGVKAGLLRELVSKDDFADMGKLARAIKALPLTVLRTRPIAEAISSAGGVSFEATLGYSIDWRWYRAADGSPTPGGDQASDDSCGAN